MSQTAQQSGKLEGITGMDVEYFFETSVIPELMPHFPQRSFVL